MEQINLNLLARLVNQLAFNFNYILSCVQANGGVSNALKRLSDLMMSLWNDDTVRQNLRPESVTEVFLRARFFPK